MSETKLKPCPFCGGEASILKNGAGCYQVYCDECETRQYAYAHKTKESAIESWNTRKPIEKVVEQLEEEKAKGHYDSNSVIGEKNVWNKAIEIVNQTLGE